MQQDIYILWDASHIWGLMAWRAVRALGLSCRLVKAQDIAQGLLSGKMPALLLVPGGTARLKAAALGSVGMEAIRQYVAEGGRYLGFCGGAGLGLSGSGGLGLCPWTRAAYTDRMQHLVSGHILSTVAPGHALCPNVSRDRSVGTSVGANMSAAGPGVSPARTDGYAEISLPVWCPGRFAPQEGTDVEVLASYQRPDADMCLADIPLASLPRDIFSTWQAVYGVNMHPDFLAGQPCVLTGSFGKGRYVLSYSHLETPDSPQANGWLAHILRELAGLEVAAPRVPVWDVDNLPVLWPVNADTAPLHAARAASGQFMALGAEHMLLFRRTPWLHGWRTGIPGAALNNLHAALGTALSLEPGEAALAFWRERKDHVARILPLFVQGVEGYLLAERLATTLSSTLPDVVDRRGLRVQREALFGQPMEGGGLYQELLEVADELVFLLGENSTVPR